jgi:acyl carrier protein
MDDKIFQQLNDIVAQLNIEISSDGSLKMDSVTFIRFVVELENVYDFEFDDDMLVMESFLTVVSVVEYVKNKITHLS